ncbi:MAG: DNA polymerase III subunit alpha [Anaerolineae bacterium]|nr:DNA polymerase III subunit alpha [Anaerolineae bacterium]
MAGSSAYLENAMNPPRYIELHAHSSHSLLDGVPSPAELVAHASWCNMPALALTDHDGLYGVVPFIRAAHEAGIKPVAGAEVTMEDNHHLTLLVETRLGYANLCQLLTLAHREQPKGTSRLRYQDLAVYSSGMIVLSGCTQGAVASQIAQRKFRQARDAAQWLIDHFEPHHVYIELQRHYHSGELRLNKALIDLAETMALPLVATGDVHYLTSDQREVHDILTCVREHTTLADAGDLLRSNDEYRFRYPEEMDQLFDPCRTALENTWIIAERCADAGAFLPDGAQTLPRFHAPDNMPPDQYLERLCHQALDERYPRENPHIQQEKAAELLQKELGIIHQLHLDNYFLIMGDIVHFARSHGILCQGRGSAANSLVAYLLGITPIDPVATNLVFERFLSLERPRPPDIDVDFAADRREEVIQYVYERYGRDHAAMACTLVTYRMRSAIRDVARVLGFPPALIERLTGALDIHDPESLKIFHRQVETFGADYTGVPFQLLLRLAPQLEHLPRHLGIHSGGMILSGPPLSTLVPLEPATMPGRTVTQWDKYALEDASMIKMDLLGLGMLAAMEDAVTIIHSLSGQRVDLDQLTPDDPEVYAMIRRGETVGVFQVESRAQANLIPNFQPRKFEDLIVQVALIRPGPLKANVVRPYLQRRRGIEPVRYPHPLLENALEETLGLVIFQEQVLKVARDLAGFTPGEGEKLRRVLGHKEGEAAVAPFKSRFMEGAAQNNVPPVIAEQVFTQLQAFGGYAFAKSHAAAFAVITYKSAWLRCYHPAAFFAALLRNQPMGFYSPNAIVAEARRHGIAIHAVDVQHSGVVASATPSGIRLGLNSVRGLGVQANESIMQAREDGEFQSLDDFVRRTRLGRRAVEALILGGALDSWNIPRRQLIWDLQSAKMKALTGPNLDLDVPDEPVFSTLPEHERMWLEYQHTGITAKQHITALVGTQLRQMGATPTNELHRWPDNTKIRVGGVIVSRRPPTPAGTVFLSIEDEYGIANITLIPEIAAAYHEQAKYRFVIVEGVIRRDGASLSVLARRVLPLMRE